MNFDNPVYNWYVPVLNLEDDYLSRPDWFIQVSKEEEIASEEGRLHTTTEGEEKGRRGGGEGGRGGRGR